MPTILVQGTSSISPGSIEIFKEFIFNSPRDIKIIFICPLSLRNDFKIICFIEKSYNAKFIFLPHSFIGIVVGPLIDLLATTLFAKLKFIDHYINFQSYGLCFFSNYSLFFHNSHYINENNTLKKGSKFKLILKKLLLINNFRRAKNIFIQTTHVLNELTYLYKSKKLNTENIKLLPISLPKKINTSTKRKFEFQLLYPTLDLPHKRCNLAIKSSCLASKINKEIGLVITISNKIKFLKEKRIFFSGEISKEEVNGFFQGSKAVLITSDKESLCLPLLEALSFSIPVIAPRLPYVEEILGDAACYFNSFNENAIKNAIIDCYEQYDNWSSKIIKRKKLYKKVPNTMKICWDNLIANL